MKKLEGLSTVVGKWSLDIIGYHPSENKLVHYEPSIDAPSWTKRRRGIRKSLRPGKSTSRSHFQMDPSEIELKQYAVFISHPKDRHSIAGGENNLCR
ncbi:MAG: hypothetical protein R3B95_11050 [Nitrospirales bacterium]|nr:hypothetical protein [Nitrospirales bacterium]